MSFPSSMPSSAARARQVREMLHPRRLRDPIGLLVALWVVNVLLLFPFMGQAGVEVAIVIAIGVFFVSLVTHLCVAAVREPHRRPALLLLALGLCLWGAGSATVNAAAAMATVTFPSPGEGLFLASYIAIFAFLLMEVPRRGLPNLSVWLEASVMCGAAACVAAFVVVGPLSESFDSSGVPVLLAVLYPLIDLALAILVLAQVMLRQRDRSLRTGVLVLGFVLLAAADSSFLLTLPSATYVFSVSLNMLYGASFALIGSAVLTRPAEVRPSPHEQLRARTLLLAAGVAMTALVLSPADGAMGWSITVTALATLAAAGGRLAVALHEAQGAAEALRLSRTDELTGLPNRRAVLADLDRHLASDRPLTLMLLDLDGFKDINDSMGHVIGDRVLVLLAERLRLRLGHRLDVARLGGDEFALVVQRDDAVEVMETGRAVGQLLAEPVDVEGLQLSVSASIGVAIRNTEDVSSTDLLRRADVAMYEAKATRSGTMLYEASQDSFTRHRLRRTEELRHGIRNGELAMWYQPQVDAATQAVTAVEALVRWHHPVEGLLTPAAFLPEARRHGLMPALSVAVIRQVLDDARRWVSQGFDFRVSINCAPPEILGGLVLPFLFEAMAEADLPRDTLLIEVTEDSFIADPERARERLLELRGMHVQAAIDDYGTGFSSLAYLRDLPVSELKLDRSFVSTLLEDASSRVIVDTTTRMAHSLGLRLVAEGVEDAPTAAALIAMDVDVLQGYHIAPPMPAASLGPWVRQWSASLGTDPASLPLASDLRRDLR